MNNDIPNGDECSGFGENCPICLVVSRGQQPIHPSETQAEQVDKPKHYTTGKIMPIDVIEDWKLGFCLGNTIKYIGRAGKKDPAKELEDLEKALWYLQREINNKKGRE